MKPKQLEKPAVTDHHRTIGLVLSQSNAKRESSVKARDAYLCTTFVWLGRARFRCGVRDAGLFVANNTKNQLRHARKIRLHRATMLFSAECTRDRLHILHASYNTSVYIYIHWLSISSSIPKSPVFGDRNDAHIMLSAVTCHATNYWQVLRGLYQQVERTTTNQYAIFHVLWLTLGSSGGGVVGTTYYIMCLTFFFGEHKKTESTLLERLPQQALLPSQ